MLKGFLVALTLVMMAIDGHAVKKPKHPKQQTPTPSNSANIKTMKGATPVDTRAKQAIIADYMSGQVLFEKNADQPMHPASMTKIMTTYLTFKNIADGRIKEDTTFDISEKAWRLGGSKMFVDINTKVKVIDLLRGVIIQSGNDACVALAEGLAGSDEAFAQEMTRVAREMGATNTNFTNSHGMPDPNHTTTARDLWLMSKHIVGYPLYRIFKEREFTYHNIKQRNRNPLLYKSMSSDGIKTGYTDKSGYGLVASANRNGQRLIVVLNGCKSSKERTQEAIKLMNWGYNTFGHYVLFQAGDLVDSAKVWLGRQDTVPLTVQKNFAVIMPRSARKRMKVSVVMANHVKAPIAKGTVMGKLVVEAPSLDQPLETPLIAAAPIKSCGFFKKIKDSISYILLGQIEEMADDIAEELELEEEEEKAKPSFSFDKLLKSEKKKLG